MSFLTIPLGVVFTTLISVLTLGAVDEKAKPIGEGTKLLAEGDRLADLGKYTDAVISYKRGMEKLLPQLRKIPFKSEVKRDVTKRKDMKALILKEIDEDMTPDEFRTNELALKAFGLLPRDFNLRETLAQVYSEEVAAFYDPKTKTMHLIEEPKSDVKKAPSFLERLFGKKDVFDKDENKTVIAHELTHALADQNYDIDAMQKAAKFDDDRRLALSALIEGEATLTMFGTSIDDWDGDEIIHFPAENLAWTFNLMTPFLSFLERRKCLRNAPPIIAESMTFPYFQGMVYCAKLTNERGWKAIDEAYRNPPLSTEQILHPEKYAAKPDLPTAIDLGRLQAGEGWKEVGRNVLGEMQILVMLRKQDGKAAAAGWDGDRYAIFEGPRKRLGLVWCSTWDSEDDAREFAQAYVRYQTSKAGNLGQPPKPIPDFGLAQPGRRALCRRAPGQGRGGRRRIHAAGHAGSRRSRVPRHENRAQAQGRPCQARERAERAPPDGTCFVDLNRIRLKEKWPASCAANADLRKRGFTDATAGSSSRLAYCFATKTSLPRAQRPVMPGFVFLHLHCRDSGSVRHNSGRSARPVPERPTARCEFRHQHHENGAVVQRRQFRRQERPESQGRARVRRERRMTNGADR